MSRHWKPDGEIARIIPVRQRRAWPAGATAGVVLVAAACLGVAAVLYKVAGPRDVFEEGATIDVDAAQATPTRSG